MKIRHIMCGISLLSLVACADQTKPLGPEPYVNDTSLQSEVSQQLTESANRSANALEVLAMEMRTRSAPAQSSIDESQLPPELAKHITTVWNGPAYELVKRIAQDMGYNYLETGNPGANPGFISIDAHDVAVAKVLEDIGYQAQSYSTVIVNPNLKRIEFRNNTSDIRSREVGSSHGNVSHVRKKVLVKHHNVAPRSSECKPCNLMVSKPVEEKKPLLPPVTTPSTPTMPSNMVPVK